MDISEEQLEEVENIIKNASDGISYADIWSACEIIGERSELSIIIHRLNQLLVIYKKDGKYFHPDAKPPEKVDPVVEEIRKLVAASPDIPKITTVKEVKETKEPVVEKQAKVVRTNLQLTTVKPLSAPRTGRFATRVEKPFKIKGPKQPKARKRPVAIPGTGSYGIVDSKNIVGSTVYAVYALRAHCGITVKEIGELTGRDSNNIRMALIRLVKLKYVKRGEGNYGVEYFWADQYKYPFLKEDEVDKKLLVISIEEFLKRKEEGTYLRKKKLSTRISKSEMIELYQKEIVDLKTRIDDLEKELKLAKEK